VRAALRPFSIPVFRALWVATALSNIGTLMHQTGAAWLMTTLTQSPVLVGLVSTAATLPVFLVGIPAGVWADRLDRRKWLIATQSWMLASAFVLAVATHFKIVTPVLLLVATLSLGFGLALNMPAWQAMVQDLVPREVVPAAVSLNSIAFNLARSIGPALGGVLIAATGTATVFFLNALSFLGPVAVLARWRGGGAAPQRADTGMWQAMGEGWRHVWGSEPLRAPLIRVVVFVVCASAVSAMAPLLARDELGLEATGFGLLLTGFGLGSVFGAVMLPALRTRFGVERVVLAAKICYGAAVLALIVAEGFGVAVAAFALAGISWTGVLVNMNVAVQFSAPAWVRGRAMSFYLLMFQGGFALGSAMGGVLASMIGLRLAYAVVGVCVVASLAIDFRLPLAKTGEGSD
jgi:MFS family permease